MIFTFVRFFYRYKCEASCARWCVCLYPLTKKEGKGWMSRTAKDLVSVDWDFVSSGARKDVHSIHPYPAKFIPQIPRQLIELFHPGDSSQILDPFCGSGTTLVEAVEMGLDCWGIDLNPLACLIAKVKTTPLPPGVGDAAQRVIRSAREKLANQVVEVPPIPRLDHWFKHDVQKSLAAIVEQIDREQRHSVREILQVALSSIIVRVSNQESNTRYAAIEKESVAYDVLGQFERAVATVSRGISLPSDNLFRRLGQATILNRDILAVEPGNLPLDIGLVVTSPPYPNAYEYWLYHKYRMYWLGMDPISVREREIGARPHYFKTNHQDERDFELQMGVCFELLAQVMRPGAKACFLIGRSIIHGRVIDNVALLQRASEPHGFVTHGIVERAIPSTRKTFNPAHSKIDREHVVVFTLQP